MVRKARDGFDEQGRRDKGPRADLVADTASPVNFGDIRGIHDSNLVHVSCVWDFRGSSSIMCLGLALKPCMNHGCASALTP